MRLMSRINSAFRGTYEYSSPQVPPKYYLPNKSSFGINIECLCQINNEVKVRRSIRAVVLEKAKMMSYEDLEEARAKRAAKEKATVEKGRGKRGRKRKSPAPEEASSVSTDNEVLEPGKAPAPWRVSVVRVY